MMIFDWLKRRSEPKQITLRGVDRALRAQRGQTILDAALEAGVPFPHSCRVGGCATCKCRVVDGAVRERTDSSYLLTGEEIADGWVLACQSVPREDVEVEVPGLSDGDGTRPVVRTGGRIGALHRRAPDVMELRVTVDEPVSFLAGQFAELAVPGVVDAPRSYSFAEAPSEGGSTDLVFHVRRVPGGTMTTWLFERARVGHEVSLAGPFGDFTLRPSAAPMLFVAGGTGLAPILSILFDARAREVARDAVVLVGARTQSGLYARAELDALRRAWLGRFDVIEALSDEPQATNWTGRRGVVTDLFADVGRLERHHAYLAGPPVMIDAALPLLRGGGVSDDSIRFDRFLDRSHVRAGSAA